MLKRGLGEKDVGREREWVLPAHLKEKWTLRGFAGVFDAIGKIPPEDGEGEGNKKGDSGGEEGKGGVGSRRGGKRVLLAIVGEDSTIVYYIVHDGIVKPRQN